MSSTEDAYRLAIQTNLGALDHSTFAALALDCGAEGETFARISIDSAIDTLPRRARLIDYAVSDRDRTHVLVKFSHDAGRDALTYATYLLTFDYSVRFPSERTRLENGHYGMATLAEGASDLAERVGTPRRAGSTPGTPDMWAIDHYEDDSPLGDAVRATDAGRVGEIDTPALDEFTSCLESRLRTPRYEDSPTLARIRDAMTAELQRRAVTEHESRDDSPAFDIDYWNGY